MDRILKVDLLSLEQHWDFLILNIIPIFFKNNVMKETKIRSIKNIWTAAEVFIKSDTRTWLLWIGDSREANI